MRLLLDTHIALWEIVDDDRLTKAARLAIADPANTVFVSVVSLWEIAIKFSIRRGRASDMPVSATEAAAYFVTAGHPFLHVRPEHALAIADLPPLHGDPLDRLLVAQAKIEPLRLLTADAALTAYGDFVELV